MKPCISGKEEQEMRFIVQRVSKASVSVEGKEIGKIGNGFLVFIGISSSDFSGRKGNTDFSDKTENSTDNFAVQIADKMVKKLIGLRIFRDENGKTNLDLKSVNGELLMISQFTLCADCRKGNRPSFVNAAEPAAAERLYHYIVEKCKQEIEKVEEGSFGADMKVELINEGPFTIVLDSEEICV